MAKYEDILNEIESKTYTPVENRNYLPTAVKRQNKSNFLDDFADGAIYLGKSALTGLAGGLTGIPSAALTDTANDLNKGNGKSVLRSAYELVDNIREWRNPAQAILNNAVKSVKNNLIKDKDSSLLQKGVNTVLDMVTPETPVNKTVQFYGSLLPSNASQKVMEANDVISTPYNNLRESLQKDNENQGKIMQIAGSTVQNIGQMLPSIAATMVTGDPNIGLATMGISAKGNATKEALEKGADLDKAVKMGNIKGQVEIGTEMITGGVNIFGKGTLDDLVEKKLIEKASTELGKKAAQLGYELAGEVSEELISDVAGTIIDKGTVDPNAKYTLNDFKDTAIVTILSTLGLNALTGGFAGNVNKVNSNNTQINSEVQNIDNNIQNNTNIQANVDTINNSIANTNNNQSNNVDNSNLYTYESTGNQKIDNLRQSAMNAGLNNSQETIHFLDTIEKVISDKNYNVLFDSSITNTNGESVNAQITTNQNGEVEIRLNPNSDRAGEFLLVHEISHAIKTQEMIDLINDFASRNEGFADAIKTIERHYGKDLTSEEVFADVCGQLFGNQEFINSLEMQNTPQSRSLIRQIYEQIKHLLNKLTKEGRYRNFVQDLEAKWRVAYQTQENNLNGETNYAIGNTNTAVLTSNQEKRIGLAKYYQENGYTQDEIWKKTGVTNSNGNRYDFYINDLVFKPGVEIKSNSEYTLKDVMNGEVFDSYPMFKDLKLHYYDIVKLAREEGITNKQYLDNVAHVSGATLSDGGILINSNNVKTLSEIENILSHEIQHKIQELGEDIPVETTFFGVDENNNFYYKEATEDDSIRAYRNNKKEIDAEVSRVMNKMTKAQRHSIPVSFITSEVARYYSITPNKINIDIFIPNLEKMYYNMTKGNDYNDALLGNNKSTKRNNTNTRENGNEINVNNSIDKYDKRTERYSRFKNFFIEQSEGNDSRNKSSSRNNHKQELDNSSFSLDKNEVLLERYVYPKQVYEVFKNEDKSKITKSIEELQKYKETLDPNTDDGWDNNFLANQQIDALESGFDNVYDYLVDREKTRLRQEADGKYGLGYKLIQDAIKQEEKNKQLQEDINNSSPFKNEQFKIIQETNPAPEESNYVWIRSPKDIKTFEEAINDEDSFTWGDYSKEDALRDLKRNKVRIYSSYAIKNGVFVSTSYQQALEYAGMDRSKVHSKEVKPNRVAWINGDEGQYASVTNISTNDDIRYSQNDNDWYKHLEGNYKASGTRTYFEDIKSNNTNILKATSKRVQNDLNEMNALKAADEAFGLDEEQNKTYKNLLKKYDKDYVKESKTKSKGNKAVNEATKTGKNLLDLSSKETSALKNKLSKYSNYTQSRLKSSNVLQEIKNIVNDYANREYTTTDENMKQVQKEIRNANIKVSDYLKKQITDYGFFRKSNFGKLKLGNQGMPVDTFYQEISNKYPEYFDSDIINDADMLTALSDFMNKSADTTEKISLLDEEIEMFANSIYDKLSEGLLTDDEISTIEKKIEDRINKKTRTDVREQLLEEMGITEDDLEAGKDINAIDMFRTDPIRLNEKVFGYKVGQKINDATINKTKHNEAERIRFLNKERAEIEKLGIKAGSAESAALQKLADGEYKYSLADLALEFPDTATQEKIKHAATVLRGKYDTYIEQINEVLVDMGYKPIRKRPDYMRHFQALDDVFSRFGTPLNKESMKQDSLPTDINGLTDEFKPGKNWFASALKRRGPKTAFDAITGIDGYLEGASNLIYHTEDIQRYRTLSGLIRDIYGQEKGLDNLANLSEDKIESRKSKIFDNNLSKYAAWLDEQANALANKKGKIDRGIEEAFGRRVYNVLNTAKKQVGSNMTGFNVRSALTNFASAVQGASKTNKIAFLKGTLSTIQNIAHNDGLINKSDFLTSRFGSEQLSQKLWQKASNAGQILMTGTDYFTANQIWRSKYFENLSKGMNETQAIKKADDFAARIMGDRSKGSTASVFNSKTLGMLTQFQLEVNNQWSSLIHDNKMDIQSGNKTGAAVVFQLGQLAAMSYMFNNLMKSLTGSSVMIDPIDLLKKIFLPDDDDKEKSLEERTTDVLGDVFNDLPFVSFLTGGRIPISEAFKGTETMLKKATGQTDSYGNDIKWSDVKDDLIESGFYWLLPTGYGQLKKTTKGLSMYKSSLPIAGSYTDSGNLRFNADESTGGVIKSALFGQYSSEEAQKYINSGYKTINSSRLQEMKDLDMSASEYRNYRAGLNEAGTSNEQKIEYVNNLDATDRQKTIMSKNILNRTDFNIKEYNKYNSYDEYNYAYHNPEKYELITSFGFKYDDYKKYYDQIKTYSGSNKKQEIWNYIEGLNISKAKKIMLYKTAGGYSIKDYEDYIFDYIDNMKINKASKEKLWKQLYE